MQSVNSHFMDHTFRAEKMPLVRNHHQVDAMDIHELEMEAYRAVLRAFIAQSDHLSWGKVGLKTDLQKELKVTDSEQNKVDNTALFCTPIGDASRKKLKPSCHSASTAKAYAPPGPPSSAAVPCSFSVRRLEEHYRNGKQNGRPAIHVDCSVEQSMKLYNPTTQVPSGAKGNCTWISLSRKGFNTQEAVPVTEKSDLIQIRVTRDLINQVQKMVFGKTVLVPAQIEEAKLILRVKFLSYVKSRHEPVSSF
ncbi:ENT domain [Dillenia turbinata]|uniref:ENT domain n=1 Tax=Dillenia turbinata TaxID=194707 RepID=A0AAN8VXB3_9MAGN